MSDDTAWRKPRRGLDQSELRWLAVLGSRAKSHFQRIAAEYLSLEGADDEPLVALSRLRDRAKLKQKLVQWMERICGGSVDVEHNLIEATCAAESIGLLWLMQEELGRVADAAFGAQSAEVRRALARALALEAETVVAPYLQPTELPKAASGPASTAPSASQRSAVRTLAHDIRNPLNGAMLHSAFLERELEDLGAPTDLLEAVTTIQAEIRRVSELLDDFVDAPQPAERPRARVPVSTLCNRAIELIARDAAAAGIEVGADIAAELGENELMLEVDMSGMLGVLSQLLEQAVEAALAGGGKVLLRARKESQSAIIEVRHDRHAFATPVPILSALMPSKHGDMQLGAGAGLNVAVKVIAEHGGTIEVDSQPGRTEFRVKLPIGVGQRAFEQIQ